MENQNKQIETTIEKQLYDLDAQYKSSTNLVKYIDEAQKFFNGNQYSDGNPDNFIRITMNMCSFSVNIKASKICGTPIFLVFTADDLNVNTEALRMFDEYNRSKLKEKAHNLQAAQNGFTNGTEITFVRWDEDDTSYKGIYKGGLVYEHIDPRNFAVANPYIQGIQNQKWAMFWDDVPLEALKDICDKKALKKLKDLQAQRNRGEPSEYKKKEYINHALVKMYTRFFRIDGEVFFMCSTDDMYLFDYPHPLSRAISNGMAKKLMEIYKKKISESNDENIDEKIIDLDIDSEDLISCAISNDRITDEEYKGIKEKFSLYPFAVFEPSPENRSFYGRSDVKQLIPIQKGINFAYSMVLKCAENNAYNKIFAKPDALNGQTITNEPSQVIVDYSGFTNGWGIKMAESQPMPNGVIDFADKMMATARVVYGFNDVMDGSITNQDMSGYMLNQMIKQSNTVIEQQQMLFWTYQEELAAIRLMYYKHYVDEAKYTHTLSDVEYDTEEDARKLLQNIAMQQQSTGTQMLPYANAKPEDFNKPTHKVKVDTISKKDMWGVNFDIAIDTMQGLNDSKLQESQFWKELVQSGTLQNADPEILEIELMCDPSISPRLKAQLKQFIENRKYSKISMLEGQIQQLGSQTEQIINYAKQLEGKLGYQSEYVKNLQSEFTNKINQANKINGALMKDLDKAKSTQTGGINKRTQAQQQAPNESTIV